MNGHEHRRTSSALYSCWTIGIINELGLITANLHTITDMWWMDTILINLTYTATCCTPKLSTLHSIQMHSLCACWRPSLLPGQPRVVLSCVIPRQIQHLLNWSLENDRFVFAEVPSTWFQEHIPKKNIDDFIDDYLLARSESCFCSEHVRKHWYSFSKRLQKTRGLLSVFLLLLVCCFRNLWLGHADQTTCCP